MKFETIEEAARYWVRGFNAFPEGILEAVSNIDGEVFNEVTVPSFGDRVYVFDYAVTGPNNPYGMVESYSEEDGMYTVLLDGGVEVQTDAEHMDLEDDWFPMWGTMWQFDDPADNWWLDEDGGIEKMSSCGFRVYEHEEYGYFFGIDGAGYDFYEEHWIPLYRARGLHWHKEDSNDEGNG